MSETEEQLRREGPRSALVAALALWLVAAALAGAGAVFVLLLGICEDGDCLPARQRLAWGAPPLALSVLPLWGAVALLFRWRGAGRGRVDWRAGAIALLLAAYGMAVGAVASSLSSDEAIYGDAAWLAFWLGSLAGWLALGFGLVLLRLHPRRRGHAPTAARRRALLLAAVPFVALAAAAALALVPESRPDGIAGEVAQRLDPADRCIGFEHHTYVPDPRARPGSLHPELTRRASSLELVRCRRSHTETAGQGFVWTFPSVAAAARAVRAAGPGDIPVCLAGREVVDAYANSVASGSWLEELCRAGLDGQIRTVRGKAPL
jgi:hypothetical protein